MRILSIGNFLNPSWDGSMPDEEHIAAALESAGHEVTRQQREERVYDAAGTKFDFILIAQWDNYAPNLLERMKAADGCPIVYWAFDHQDQNQEWHQRLILGADLYLSKRIADSIYPNWQWLSQDFAPDFLQIFRHGGTTTMPELPQDIDVLFTGSYLPWATERNETLKAIDDKFNLVIHSVNQWPGFKDVRPPIMDDGLPRLYARAKVVISIDHTLENGYWSDRNSQIMSCGIRPLFRYIPLSETRFGDYVDYFYSVEDCLVKIEEKLTSPKPLRVDIKTYEFAQSNLKVGNRVRNLLTIVEGIL